MKALKKSLLVLIFALVSTVGLSQSGWNTGKYYAYQGGTQTQYQYQNVWSNWCNCYQTVKYCRQLSWYKEYRSGYVYYWGSNGWYSQYKEGYYWYCNWTGWYVC